MTGLPYNIDVNNQSWGVNFNSNNFVSYSGVLPSFPSGFPPNVGWYGWSYGEFFIEEEVEEKNRMKGWDIDDDWCSARI